MTIFQAGRPSCWVKRLCKADGNKEELPGGHNNITVEKQKCEQLFSELLKTKTHDSKLWSC